jgi:hypothetical protein
MSAQLHLYRASLSEGKREFIESIEQAADSTPAKDKGLALHTGAIEKLRAKGYSYRDIAAWFNERGFKVNHVDAWRAHRNSMEIDELIDTAEADSEWKEYVKKERTETGVVYTQIDPEAEAKLAAESSSETPNPPVVAGATTNPKTPGRRAKAKRTK